MRYLVSGEQMQEIDRYTCESVGIPSIVLMERAALAVSQYIEEQTMAGDSVLIVCGMGNNGADGAAVARMLRGKKRNVAVLLAGEPERASEEMKLQLSILERLSFHKAGHLWRESSDASGHSLDFSEYTIIVDALFGTGLKRAVDGEYESLIGKINHSGAKVVAIDIPSGIHSATGAVMHTAARADTTITFGYGKTGLWLYPGAEYAGKIVVADIGFPEEAIHHTNPDTALYEVTDLVEQMPQRLANSHKGSYGKVLVIAGNKNMCGAAYFAAKAALKTGAGLVKILTCEDNRIILQQKLPEAVLETVNRSKPDWSAVEGALGDTGTIVFGPGLGVDAYTKAILLKVLLHTEANLVLDADGINQLAVMCREDPGLWERLKRRGNIIYTPHLMEMERWSGDSRDIMRADRISYVREQAGRYGGVLVLKDARTVVSEGQHVYVNISGNHGMATAGSGDVLSGVIGGLLAQHMPLWEAAKLGVFLHGMAGDAVRKETGSYAMTAEDILRGISFVTEWADRNRPDKNACPAVECSAAQRADW